MGVTNCAQSTQIVYAVQLIVYFCLQIICRATNSVLFVYFPYYLYTFVMDLQVPAGANIKILTLGRYWRYLR